MPKITETSFTQTPFQILAQGDRNTAQLFNSLNNQVARTTAVKQEAIAQQARYGIQMEQLRLQERSQDRLEKSMEFNQRMQNANFAMDAIESESRIKSREIDNSYKMQGIINDRVKTELQILQDAERAGVISGQDPSAFSENQSKREELMSKLNTSVGIDTKEIGERVDEIRSIHKNYENGSPLTSPLPTKDNSQYNDYLKGIRTKRFESELKGNATLQMRMSAVAEAEVGKDKNEQIAFLETLFNRAEARGVSLNAALDPRYYATRGVFNKRVPIRKDVINAVVNGSNISQLATDNASNDYRNRNALANKRISQGRRGIWTGGDTDKGEFLYNDGPYEGWYNEVKPLVEQAQQRGGAPDPSLFPNTDGYTFADSGFPTVPNQAETVEILSNPAETLTGSKAKQSFYVPNSVDEVNQFNLQIDSMFGKDPRLAQSLKDRIKPHSDYYKQLRQPIKDTIAGITDDLGSGVNADRINILTQQFTANGGNPLELQELVNTTASRNSFRKIADKFEEKIEKYENATQAVRLEPAAEKRYLRNLKEFDKYISYYEQASAEVDRISERTVYKPQEITEETKEANPLGATGVSEEAQDFLQGASPASKGKTAHEIFNARVESKVDKTSDVIDAFSNANEGIGENDSNRRAATTILKGFDSKNYGKNAVDSAIKQGRKITGGNYKPANSKTFDDLSNRMFTEYQKNSIYNVFHSQGDNSAISSQLGNELQDMKSDKKKLNLLGSILISQGLKKRGSITSYSDMGPVIQTETDSLEQTALKYIESLQQDEAKFNLALEQGDIGAIVKTTRALSALIN